MSHCRRDRCSMHLLLRARALQSCSTPSCSSSPARISNFFKLVLAPKTGPSFFQSTDCLEYKLAGPLSHDTRTEVVSGSLFSILRSIFPPSGRDYSSFLLNNMQQSKSSTARTADQSSVYNLSFPQQQRFKVLCLLVLSLSCYVLLEKRPVFVRPHQARICKNFSKVGKSTPRHLHPSK